MNEEEPFSHEEQLNGDKKVENPSTEKKTKTPPPSPAPPRGPNLKIVILVLVVALAMLGAGIKWGSRISTGVSHIVDALRGEEESSKEGSLQYYTCGMHPWVILPKAGDCPICHMKLTPLDPAKFTGEVTIDPIVTQNIGVRVEPVVSGPLARSIRTVGTVTYDETTLRDVNIKINGWIEKLFVDSLGVEIEKGQPLFELYSRDLFSAQEEYLLALRSRGQPGAEFLPRSKKDSKDLLRSARTRLEYYDIPQQEIEALEKRGKLKKTMTLVSPHKGVVIEKHANEGMRVETGMRLYRIADLSRIWVMVTLYEFQLPFVSLGQKAVMTLPYIPGQLFEGKVSYIYPYLNEKTRELNVRLEFENPNLLLKPGMYSNIELRSVLAEERTLAPRSAVISTGERQFAFVSLGEGRFEPRKVQMGIEAEKGMVEILDGLKPGELVVTSAQFLIDSESKMREALAKMVKGQPASEQKASSPTAGRSELSSLPEKASSVLLNALEGYLAIGDRLASDSTDGMAPAAREIAGAVDELLKIEIPEDPHFWHKHTESATVRGKALELVQEQDLEKARLKFADLSVALSNLVKATGVPPSSSKKIQELHCPMYREGQGGSIWLQPEGKVRNPFFGSSMLQCFDERITLPVTGDGDSTGDVEKKVPSDSISLPGEDKQEASTTQPSSTEVNKATKKSASAIGEAKAKSSKLAFSQKKTASPQTEVDRLIRAYLDLQVLLSRDKFETAKENLEIIHQASSALGRSGNSDIKVLAARIAGAVPKKPSDIDELRISFKALSEAVYHLVKTAPPSTRIAPVIYRAYCPMAKGSWLQASESIRNPYYGASMLTCGEIKETIKARE